MIRPFISLSMTNDRKLYLKELKGKGRAVFCNKDIAAGEIIDSCPVIVIPAEHKSTIEKTKLVDYCFYFDKKENTLSLVMGLGSMYNYARYPNAAYELDRENKMMNYTALEHIPAHTEITINYGGEHGFDYSKWFLDRGITALL